MKKMLVLIVMMSLSMLLFAGLASAHVVVYPKEVTQGSYEKFTVRVPSEEEAATVKVEVKIPEGVTVSRFEPKPGWDYEIVRDASEKIISVTWTATGEGLSLTEFTEFNMSGKVGDEATDITWKAYQTYKDGLVVEWVGAEDSDKPAPVTAVKEKPAGADGHGHMAEAPVEHGVEASDLPLYISIVALCLGLVSLLVSLRRKGSK
ncbi:MAG TPA: YcnI family protein [Bacilli bacterium]